MAIPTVILTTVFLSQETALADSPLKDRGGIRAIPLDCILEFFADLNVIRSELFVLS